MVRKGEIGEETGPDMLIRVWWGVVGCGRVWWDDGGRIRGVG